MLRKFIGAFAAIIALTCIVAGSIRAWPNSARSTDSPAFMARADFDDVFVSAATRPQRPAFLTMTGFERLIAGDDAAGDDVMPRHDYVGVLLMAIDFEGAFGSVSAPRRDNTPPNREKLRNAGWKRILGPG